MAEPSEKKKARPVVDWERVETDYRAGLLSVREIAAENGISHTAIQKRAKAEGWERDLSAKIRAKADALVAKQQVASEVAAETKATERRLVEANAEVIADVRMRHRQDIGRSRALVMKLLGELESQTDRQDLIERLDELLASDEESGISDKLRSLYQGVTSLPGRTKTMKDLADALTKLVGLEREAYGLPAAKEPAGGDGDVGGVAIYLPANGR